MTPFPAVHDSTIQTETQQQLVGIIRHRLHSWHAVAEQAGLKFADTAVLLADLGLSQNAYRMKRGIFTGMALLGDEWLLDPESALLPSGLTLNSDRCSVWKLETSPSEAWNRLRSTRDSIRQSDGGILWNFESGNHLAAITVDSETSTPYLVLHGGSAEFKAQCYGLYEQSDIWQRARDSRLGPYLTGRPLQLLLDIFGTADSLVQTKHRIVAEMSGASTKLSDTLHYWIDQARGVGVGAQWVNVGEMAPLLTSPSDPILLVEAGVHAYRRAGKHLLPHGLGAEGTASVDWSEGGESLRVSVGGIELDDSATLRFDSHRHLWRIRSLDECLPTLAQRGMIRPVRYLTRFKTLSRG